jgi:hypothetical protein
MTSGGWRAAADGSRTFEYPVSLSPVNKPSQDVRQRIRHRVHRCRCLRHHSHGGRSDQEGRVSLAINAAPPRFILHFYFGRTGTSETTPFHNDAQMLGTARSLRNLHAHADDQGMYKLGVDCAQYPVIRFDPSGLDGDKNEIRFRKNSNGVPLSTSLEIGHPLSADASTRCNAFRRYARRISLLTLDEQSIAGCDCMNQRSTSSGPSAMVWMLQ